MATAEDSPLAMKLKKTWLRTPVGEEQAAQAVLDPSIGINYKLPTTIYQKKNTFLQKYLVFKHINWNTVDVFFSLI